MGLENETKAGDHYLLPMAIYRGRGRTKSHKWGMCYIEEYPEFTGREEEKDFRS